MAITVSDIDEMVARFGNDIIHEQANLEAPLLSILDTIKEPGRVGFVNVKAGGLTSTGWVADQGTLPTASQVTPVQASYVPKFLFSKIAIPRGAATLATGEMDGINIVHEEMESCGQDLGRQFARSIVGGLLETLAASQVGAGELTASASSATDDTFTVADPGKYRIGMTIQRYDASNNLEEHMTVSAVTLDLDGTSHRVSVDRVQSSALGTDNNDTLVAGDKLYLQGAYADACVSLQDVTSSTGAVYGLAAASNEWAGNDMDAAGALDTTKMRNLTVGIARRRKQKFDCSVMNSKNEQRYVDQLLGARRFVPGSKMDASGGEKTEFDGKPIEIDENVGDSEIFFLNKKDVKIHEFKPFGDDMDGGPVGEQKSGGSLRHVNISDTVFEYTVQRWGAFNLRAQKRNGCGRLYGITS